MSLPIADGLLVVVKDDCETCHLVEPVLAELAGREGGVADRLPGSGRTFPRGSRAIHDRELDISWRPRYRDDSHCLPDRGWRGGR